MDFPSSLPNPTRLDHDVVLGSFLTSLPGGKPNSATKSRDLHFTLQLDFFYTAAQAAVFYDFWLTDLLQGGLPFNANWPNITGGIISVQFIAKPSFQHIYNGAFRISVLAELRRATYVFSDGPPPPPPSKAKFYYSWNDVNTYKVGSYTEGDAAVASPTVLFDATPTNIGALTYWTSMGSNRAGKLLVMSRRGSGAPPNSNGMVSWFSDNNGASWTMKTPGFGGYLISPRAMLWVAGRWSVFGGDSASLGAYSDDDGTTWTAQYIDDEDNSGSAGGFNCAYFDGTKYIIARGGDGWRPMFFTSSDISSGWLPVNAPAIQSLVHATPSKIVLFKGRYLATVRPYYSRPYAPYLSINDGTPSGQVLWGTTGTDLTTWSTVMTLVSTSTGTAMAMDDDKNVLVIAVSTTTGTTIYRSTNGTSFTPVQSFGFTVCSLLYENGLFAAISGNSGSALIYISSDLGLTWDAGKAINAPSYFTDGASSV